MVGNVDISMEPGAVSAGEVDKPSHKPVIAPRSPQGSTRVTKAVAAVDAIPIASAVDGIRGNVAQGDAAGIKVAIDTDNSLPNQENNYHTYHWKCIVLIYLLQVGWKVRLFKVALILHTPASGK